MCGTGDHRALHDVEADAAATDDRDRRARRDLRGVEHRAETGGDRAAHERGDVDRHLVVDLQQRLLGKEHLLGESADARELVDGDAVLRQRRAEAGSAGGPVLAHVRTTGRARRTQSARRRRARDHLVARTEVGDVGTDRLDDARRLVPQDRRHADRQRPSMQCRSLWHRPRRSCAPALRGGRSSPPRDR